MRKELNVVETDSDQEFYGDWMSTYYDRHGTPVAYNDDETIYLFSGEPVAYLDSDSVYSFSGRHLGWLLEGWVLDHQGRRVYFTEEATGGPVRPVRRVSPIRRVRRVRPVKRVQRVRPVRPVRSLSWSNFEGDSFFRQ